MDTTRRYPRTLGEAFKDASYGCAVEVYRVPMLERVGGVLLAVLIGMAGACALVAWWS